MYYVLYQVVTIKGYETLQKGGSYIAHRVAVLGKEVT